LDRGQQLNHALKDVVRPMIEASAAQYAKEHGITLRSCDG
jgi:hypothetical protein